MMKVIVELTVFSHGPSTRRTMPQLLVRHIITDLSSDWLAIKDPMGSHANPFTRLWWPVRTAIVEPVDACQIRTVLSRLQLASCESSGDHPRSTYFKESTDSQLYFWFSALWTSLGHFKVVSLPHSTKSGQKKWKQTCQTKEREILTLQRMINRRSLVNMLKGSKTRASKMIYTISCLINQFVPF